ncbi:MAG TPA: hypothetical protein VK656_06190 [Candidatus Acidoferrum sp.]|nr:hypothetical protein [Candidatus Acidoferrum sp.]
MAARFPSPGPSFLREQSVRVRDREMRAAMSRPSEADGGWWLAMCWVSDDEGLVSFRDVAPAGGPPPEPPAIRLGPSLAGSLSGLVLEEGGRLQFRVAPLSPPADPRRPWDSPLAVLIGIRPEPMRAAAMRPNELAEAVLAGFRRTIEGLSRP